MCIFILGLAYRVCLLCGCAAILCLLRYGGLIWLSFAPSPTLFDAIQFMLNSPTLSSLFFFLMFLMVTLPSPTPAAACTSVSLFFIVSQDFNPGAEFNILLRNGLNQLHPPILYFVVIFFIFYFFSLCWWYRAGIKHHFNFARFRFYAGGVSLMTFCTLFMGAWWAWQESSWGGWWVWELSECLLLVPVLFIFMIFHFCVRAGSFSWLRLVWIGFFLCALWFWLWVKSSFNLTLHSFAAPGLDFIWMCRISLPMIVTFFYLSYRLNRLAVFPFLRVSMTTSGFLLFVAVCYFYLICFMPSAELFGLFNLILSILLGSLRLFLRRRVLLHVCMYVWTMYVVLLALCDFTWLSDVGGLWAYGPTPAHILHVSEWWGFVSSSSAPEQYVWGLATSPGGFVNFLYSTGFSYLSVSASLFASCLAGLPCWLFFWFIYFV